MMISGSKCRPLNTAGRDLRMDRQPIRPSQRYSQHIQQNHLPGDIWNGSMREMPPEEELAYYQLARQHRFLPLIYAYRPGLKINGTNVTLDWTEYDQRLAPYLDGSAFTAQHGYWGPGYG